MVFDLVCPYPPDGDQPQAIAKLTERLQAGEKHNVLLGVTGSGKTFTIANVIANLDRPALVFSHNKTLAAQLYSELKQFFPNNAVEYFVSYFDYYQPEAYIPRSDTYIEKDSSVNEEIERLRLAATSSLLSRRDVIVVASVSCIYGLGSPEDYKNMVCPLAVGEFKTRDQLLAQLVEMQYARNDIALTRGNFRVRGDVVELCPGYTEDALRIEFFGDELDRITRFDPLTGEQLEALERYIIFPAKHFVTPHEKLRRALVTIREELAQRLPELENQGKLLEAQRLKMRTDYDLEMMEEMGFCNGVENYSRHLAMREPGSRPYTLLDFFPEDYITIIDESHATIPQIGGMYEGDRSRKTTLVEHGFRLPSALDNRPLKFAEWENVAHQRIYVSATPGPYELKAVGAYGPEGNKDAIAEQIIRPTGLVDPRIIIKPLAGQIDDLIEQAKQRVEVGERVLVTTLTKRTAEDLAEYLKDLNVKVRYIHSEVDTIERVEILRSLRLGEVDVLVGINLLREGLDLPEVSLVAILDADKEGFLRSDTSLIQTAGRAARHINGLVILYADTVTGSMKRLLDISDYRRNKQLAYNKLHGITPRSAQRAVQESLTSVLKGREVEASVVRETGEDMDILAVLQELETEMLQASERLDFERAAILRDQMVELKDRAGIEKMAPTAKPQGKSVNYGGGKRGKGKAPVKGASMVGPKAKGKKRAFGAVEKPF
ncbi:MAG: excinuclease ABC subunit UvrB [Candidatus Methylacidiphilales bacterium]|nr:excinuclease ABC subunit UvrB [Candidatus Methylacidiphilales bacterium]